MQINIQNYKIAIVKNIMMNICSLNINGVRSSKSQLITYLEQFNPDALCLQETKQISLESLELNKIGYDYFMKTPNDVTSAIEQTIHGNAIIFKSSIRTEKILINHPDPVTNARIVGIKLLDYDTLLVSCYLPATGSLVYKCSNKGIIEENDSDKSNVDTHLEMINETLAFLETVIDDHPNCIIAGDFNYDTFRDNNRKSRLLDAALQKYTQHDRLTLETSPVPITYSTKHAARYLDRILSTLPEECCTEYKISKDQYICSDHVMIQTKFKLVKSENVLKHKTKTQKKPNWNKVEEKHIDSLLQKLNRLIKRDFAKSPKNDYNMQRFCEKIHDLELECYPLFKDGPSKSLSPEFLERTKETRDKFNSWSRLLRLDPSNEEYKKMKEKCRLQWKIETKEYHKEQDKLKAAHVAKRNAFENLKRKNVKPLSPPSYIEGVEPSKQLDLWHDHYTQVYIGQPHPKKLVDHLPGMKDEVRISLSSYHLLAVIDQINIKKAFTRHHFWKKVAALSKARPVRDLLIDYFNAWLKDIYDGKDGNWKFLTTCITPTLKSEEKPKHIKKSYRPIALMSSECWLLEKCIKLIGMEYFSTRDSQFGYKSGHGCIQAIEIARQFNYKPDVHILLLDNSSAFDFLSHDRFRDQMMKRKVPLRYIYIFMALLYYTNYKIKWFDGTTEAPIYPTRGTKQGGVLSALIFSCCYDSLIERLDRLHPGVFVNGMHINHLIFADDCLLASTSITGLELLYKEVVAFFEEYKDLKLNPDKSVILRVGTDKRKPESFNNIPTDVKSRYLGAYLFDNMNAEQEINRCVRSLYVRANTILKNQTHLKYLDNSSKRAIASAFGSPYGLELLPGVNSTLRKCHRYLTQILWPGTRYDKSGERRLIIHSTDLYAESGIPSLPNTYQKIRNNMILKAKISRNKIIRKIIGRLRMITTREIKSMLVSNARCRFRFRSETPAIN